MADLLPCPFCGSERLHSGACGCRFEDMEETTIYRVMCRDCKCKTGAFDTPMEAIESWNNRRTAKIRRLTKDEMIDYVDKVNRKFNCICTNCETLCFDTDNFCASCGAKLEEVQEDAVD